MKIEKIKRLIEILVERELKRQLPIIKTQILFEITTSNSSQSKSRTHDFLTRYKPTSPSSNTKPVFSNPILNEIMQSTKPLNDDVLGVDTILSEVKTEQSKKVLDIMMRKYDVGNISPEFSPTIDEDLSFLDGVK